MKTYSIRLDYPNGTRSTIPLKSKTRANAFEEVKEHELGDFKGEARLMEHEWEKISTTPHFIDIN